MTEGAHRSLAAARVPRRSAKRQTVVDSHAGPLSGLLEYLNLNPRVMEQSVYKYLRHEDGAHGLHDIRHKALIACTSRTGSSLLQVCLERYGIDAQEFFNPEGHVKRAVEAGKAKSIREYANLLTSTAVKDGRFSVKGGIGTLLFLYCIREIPERLQEWRVVFVSRRNVVRQAVSMQIAAITGQWTAAMPAEHPVAEGDYSFDELAKKVNVIHTQNDLWERVFAAVNIVPLRVYYEDLCKHLDGMAERTARFMGVDTAAFADTKASEPRLQQQSTDVNDNWEKRFRRELETQIRQR